MAAQPFDTYRSRLSFGEIVAGVSALVLLIAMFLPWYGVTVKGSVGAFSASRSANADAWEAFGGRDVLLFVIALLVLGYVLLRALDVLPSPMPLDTGLAILVLGGLAVLMVLIGIIHIPTGGQSSVNSSFISVDFSRKFGLFLGFLATCGIAYGGWAAYNESRRGVVPGAAGPGGALGGPGAVPPPSGGTAQTQPLATPGAGAGAGAAGAGLGAAGTPGATTPGTGGTTAPGSSEFGSTPPASTPPASTPPASTPPASTPPASTPPVTGGTPGAGPGTGEPSPTAGTPGPPPPQQQPQSPPPDWYPDPHGQARLRWWDGSQWTDQTAD